MAPRSYPRLSIEDFGAQLLKSGDIDPVYIALNAMEWSEAQRNRWLVAYWLCYHPGAASWLSEQPDYWGALAHAAANSDRVPAPGNIGRWPRAPERRHWRGVAAVKSVEDLRVRYRQDGPQAMVTWCGWGGRTRSLPSVGDGPLPSPRWLPG